MVKKLLLRMGGSNGALTIQPIKTVIKNKCHLRVILYPVKLRVFYSALLEKKRCLFRVDFCFSFFTSSFFDFEA